MCRIVQLGGRVVDSEDLLCLTGRRFVFHGVRHIWISGLVYKVGFSDAEGRF